MKRLFKILNYHNISSMFEINYGKVSKIRNDCYYVILWNDYQEIRKKFTFL